MSKKFEVPESIADLSVDELLDAISAGKKYAAGLVADEDATDDAIAEAEAIIEFTTKAQERITELRAAETERAEKLARIRNASAEEEPEEEAPEEETPETDEIETEEPAAEVESEVEPELEAVAASTTKVSARKRAADAAPEPEAPMSKKTVAIVAAADISGIPAGSTLDDLGAVAKAAQKRLASFPTHRIGGKEGTMLRQGIATFDLSGARTDGLVLGNKEFGSDQAILEYASKESRLAGNSLTAATGWCAPSDTLMDFCVEESTDGILDLPTVSAPRGSVRYTKGPDFAAIFADANGDFNLTEAQVEADTAKVCTDVECPDWTEVSLGVTGVCIGAGILTNSAYPELIRRYTEAVLIAHQHKVAGRMYAGIIAGSTALTFAGAAATAVDSLAYFELAAEYIRQTKRMSRSTTLEVPMPYYVRAIYRADLAMRGGDLGFVNVTDAQLDAYFATRGIRVQWLYNVGDITNTAGELSIPASITVPMYAAGTWVRLTKDVITLDGVYDSTNIKTNTFTHLFTEEGIALVNMCGTSYKVTIPLCASGRVGAADYLGCTLGDAVTP